MIAVEHEVRTGTTLRDELAKWPAFFRRDALVAWSYRTAFLTDWGNLVFQAALFYLIGRMVNPATLPVYGGTRASYMEFVAVGIAVSAFMTLALVRVSANLRQEQLMGTLEAVLLTPTSPSTIQFGSVAYDLVYIPIRTGLFLLFAAIGFGLRFNASGIVPAALLLLAFIPFVWGLGILNAATTLTVRRGGAVAGYLIIALTIGSGAYFPVTVLPGWLQSLASANPMTTAVNGMREALLGTFSAGALLHALAILALAACVTVALGVAAFRLALAREQRRGTLGQY